MRENKTSYAILGLLSHEDMTGYDLKKRIENTLGFFWSAGYGQIYPALILLEKQGYVAKRTEDQKHRPKRIVYSMTPAGTDSLTRWLARPVEKEDVKFEILLKLFFGKLSPVGKNISIIEEFKKRNECNLNIMKAFKAQLEGILPQSEDHLYYYLTTLFGEKIYTAYLQWADEAAALLKKEEIK
jgi:DNA-binding PadR family transcriptional regulator